MIRLDSLKLSLPESCLSELDTSYFQEITTRSPLGDEKKVWEQVLEKPIGLKAVRKDDKGSLVLELSGKVLKENYFELINRNTIEQAIAGLNESPALKLDSAETIDKAVVLRADSTNNLKVSGEIPTYIRALGTIRSSRFRSENYREESIVFSGRQKYIKPRMIFYEKLPELMRDKEILPYVNLRQYQGILRCECNLRSFKLLREGFCEQGKEGEVLLKEVLCSDKNPNFQLFKKLREPIPELFEEYEGKELYHVEKVEGRKRIIEQLNYDPDLIQLFLMQRLHRTTAYRYLKEYKALLQEMLRGKEGRDKGIPEGYTLMLQELESLLQAA